MRDERVTGNFVGVMLYLAAALGLWCIGVSVYMHDWWRLTAFVAMTLFAYFCAKWSWQV